MNLIRRSTIFLLSNLLLLIPLGSYAAEEEIPPESSWQGILRVNTLKKLDNVLALTFNQQSRSFVLAASQKVAVFNNTPEALSDFAKTFGYFSSLRPLVGKVTNSEADIQLTCGLLKAVHAEIKDLAQRMLTTGEILTKVLAYRDLKNGMRIPIALQENLILYEVDTVFNLWHGMPAFGLIPVATSAPPLLLFRGTDFSLSQRGWASMLSDMDPKGPGLAAFRHARPAIHDWLQKAGRGARVMGFSLGGTLTAYTDIYEHPWLSKDEQAPHLAFNPAGISQQMLSRWRERGAFRVYVTQGDLVSKVGFLWGAAVQLSVDHFFNPIMAHTALITAFPPYQLSPLNLPAENASRK